MIKMRRGFVFNLIRHLITIMKMRFVLAMNLIINPNSHDENKMSIYYELNQPPK